MDFVKESFGDSRVFVLEKKKLLLVPMSVSLGLINDGYVFIFHRRRVSVFLAHER